MTEPKRPKLRTSRIDYFFLDAPLTAISSTLSPVQSVNRSGFISTRYSTRYKLTWGEGLLELLGLLGIVNQQSV